MSFRPGDEVLFVKDDFPLTRKRGRVLFVNKSLLTIEFENERGVSTWRASYFTHVNHSSLPPCGAV